MRLLISPNINISNTYHHLLKKKLIVIFSTKGHSQILFYVINPKLLFGSIVAFTTHYTDFWGLHNQVKFNYESEKKYDKCPKVCFWKKKTKRIKKKKVRLKDLTYFLNMFSKSKNLKTFTNEKRSYFDI